MTDALSTGCLRRVCATAGDDEGEVGEVDPALGVLGLLPGPESRDPGVVDLDQAVHVRRDPPRHDHVIGGELADPRPGLDPVALPGLDHRPRNDADAIAGTATPARRRWAAGRPPTAGRRAPAHRTR